MTLRVLGSLIVGGLLLAGCQMGNRSVARDRSQIGPGQALHCYGLVRIDPDGKAVFRNLDMGEHGELISVSPGQSFGVEEQSRHTDTVYRYTIEQTDPKTQQATVLGEVAVTPR